MTFNAYFDQMPDESANRPPDQLDAFDTMPMPGQDQLDAFDTMPIPGQDQLDAFDTVAIQQPQKPSFENQGALPDGAFRLLPVALEKAFTAMAGFGGDADKNIAKAMSKVTDRKPAPMFGGSSTQEVQGAVEKYAPDYFAPQNKFESGTYGLAEAAGPMLPFLAAGNLLAKAGIGALGLTGITAGAARVIGTAGGGTAYSAFNKVANDEEVTAKDLATTFAEFAVFDATLGTLGFLKGKYNDIVEIAENIGVKPGNALMAIKAEAKARGINLSKGIELSKSELKVESEKLSDLIEELAEKSNEVTISKEVPSGEKPTDKLFKEATKPEEKATLEDKRITEEPKVKFEKERVLREEAADEYSESKKLEKSTKEKKKYKEERSEAEEIVAEQEKYDTDRETKKQKAQRLERSTEISEKRKQKNRDANVKKVSESLKKNAELDELIKKAEVAAETGQPNIKNLNIQRNLARKRVTNLAKISKVISETGTKNLADTKFSRKVAEARERYIELQREYDRLKPVPPEKLPTETIGKQKKLELKEKQRIANEKRVEEQRLRKAEQKKSRIERVEAIEEAKNKKVKEQKLKADKVYKEEVQGKQLDKRAPKLITFDEKPPSISSLRSEVNAKLPKNRFIERARKFLKINETDISKEGWEAVRNLVGDQNVSAYESSLKFKIKYQKMFSRAEQSDMRAYIERTGNKFHSKADTYEDLLKRLPKKAKDFADEVIRPHSKEQLRINNEAEFAQNIAPREGLDDIYVSHFYEGNHRKNVAKYTGFSTKNKLANKRTHLTYDEAIEAGLTPKHESIFDIMHETNAIMMRAKTNSALVGAVKNIEKKLGKKLVVREGNFLYNKAAADGWVETYDPFWRRHKVGKGKDGKPIFATSEKPALMHPELARSMQGVFQMGREATPKFGVAGTAIAKAVNGINSISKFASLQFSPFHIKTLLESSHAQSGTVKFMKRLWSPIKTWDEAAGLLENPEIYKPAVKAGLVIHPVDPNIKTGAKIDSLLKKLEINDGLSKKAAQGIRSVIKPFQEVNKFIFGKMHPRLKILAYQDAQETIAKAYAKKGKALPANADREIAAQVNNILGGLNWRTIEKLNNPVNKKMLENTFAYADWTTAALREAFDLVSSSPIRRSLAGRYMLKYGSQLIVSANILNKITTGLYNKKDGSIGYDYARSKFTWENDDPTKNPFHIQMPDLKGKILGVEYYWGRDENGKRKFYIHEGKKLHELAGWYNHPMTEFFNKSQPVFRMMIEQLFDKGLGSNFPTNAGYKDGKLQAWGGTEEGSWERFKSRAAHIASFFLPYSVGGLRTKGVAPYIASGGGAVPVSSGASTHSMQPYIEKALINNDNKALSTYIKVLRDNGYEDPSIRRTITKAKNKIEKGKK